MRAHHVRALLMGGQACVFYGAAEFSRDTDFAILADAANLARLRQALAELQAELVAVPPFALRFLRRGHAIHFRCQHPEAFQMRVDVMSQMRGVDAFGKLWRRRTTLQIPGSEKCDLLSLPDLVQSKHTILRTRGNQHQRKCAFGLRNSGRQSCSWNWLAVTQRFAGGWPDNVLCSLRRDPRNWTTWSRRWWLRKPRSVSATRNTGCRSGGNWKNSGTNVKPITDPTMLLNRPGILGEFEAAL
jgi:hypothetical protein